MTNVAEQRLRLPPAGPRAKSFAARWTTRRPTTRSGSSDSRPGPTMPPVTTWSRSPRRRISATSRPTGSCPSTFPSLARFEREVVDYAAGLLHGPDAVGSITSGGSESILMGVKSARDRARAVHPEIRAPRMVVPESAHPAFWKAAHYFGLELVRDAARRRPPDRRRRLPRGDRRLDGAARGLRAEPHARDGRPDRRARAAGPGAGHQLPCRFVRRRLLPAVRREARLSGPTLRFPGPGRDHDLRRPAQVRLHGQGRIADHVARPRDLSPPDLQVRGSRTARRLVRDEVDDRDPAGWRHRRGVGRHDLPGRGRLHAASSARRWPTCGAGGTASRRSTDSR